MKFRDNLAFGLIDLKRRKIRTFLTSFGIMLGGLLILLMVSLGVLVSNVQMNVEKSGGAIRTINIVGIKAKPTKITEKETQSGQRVLWAKKNFENISATNLEKISKLKNVDDIEAFIGASVGEIKLDGKEYQNLFNIKGYDIDYNTYFQSALDSARVTSNNENLEPYVAGTGLQRNEKNEVVVGENVLQKLKVKNPKDIIGKKIDIVLNNINGVPQKPINIDLKVVGVTSKYMPNGNDIVMNTEDIVKVMDFLQNTTSFMKTYGYDGAVVESNTINNVPLVAKEIKNVGYLANSVQSNVKSIEQESKQANMILAFLGIVVIAVAGIGIINTMFMSVQERTKSIGIMRAVGASSKNIQVMITVQAGLIGLLGSLIAIILGTPIFMIISNLIKEKAVGNTVIFPSGVWISTPPLWLMIGVVVFSVVVGILAGILPSIRAARLNPVVALKG